MFTNKIETRKNIRENSSRRSGDKNRAKSSKANISKRRHRREKRNTDPESGKKTDFRGYGFHFSFTFSLNEKTQVYDDEPNYLLKETST